VDHGLSTDLEALQKEFPSPCLNHPKCDTLRPKCPKGEFKVPVDFKASTWCCLMYVQISVRMARFSTLVDPLVP
jgi:hypothetical protein